MEETFRLIVLDGRQIVLPRRLLRTLGIDEGDEVRIVTDHGTVKAVSGVKRERNVRSQDDDVLGKSRLEEIRNGKYDDTGRLNAELKNLGTASEVALSSATAQGDDPHYQVAKG
jgi:bifunctional DNA-binding transcriptional regulator/antitoxin component of YhaV-PrlF toxin-antitoxin module